MCKPLCKTVLHYLAWVAIIGNIVLIIVTAFWSFYPYPLPYVEQPIEILNKGKAIAVGETIEMDIRIVKLQEAKAIVRPNITCEDGSIIPMVSKDVTLPVGEFIVKNTNYSLPLIREGSVCQVNFDVDYQVNPIRTEHFVWESQQFRVVKE